MHSAQDQITAHIVTDTRQYLRSLGIVPPRYAAPDWGGCVPGYARRRDTTHAAVRDALRDAGYSVFDAGNVGGDFPDLVVGAHGVTFLVEVKSPGGKLSAGQRRFSDGWRGGPVVVAYNAEQALGHIVTCVRAMRGRGVAG